MVHLSKILENIEFKNINLQKYQIKLFESSDYDRLMNLYNEVFPNYMTKDLWEWKNLKNPFGNYITILMSNKSELIGSYSLSPAIFIILGKEILCVQSMDTMTKKVYRGQGISTYLAKLSYEYAKQRGFNFVYGFPNRNSTYLFRNKLHWNIFGKIELFYKQIPLQSKRLNHEFEYNIKEIEFFDKKIDEFWKNYYKNIPITIKKDKDYLNWRFVDHPTINYRKFILIDKITGKIISLFILKIYQNEKGIKIGHIVDYIILHQALSLKIRIFKIIESYSLKVFNIECSQISLWIFDEDLKNIAINQLNYKIFQIETNFGYKVFKKYELLEYLNVKKNWKINMSNSDVF